MQWQHVTRNCISAIGRQTSSSSLHVYRDEPPSLNALAYNKAYRVLLRTACSDRKLLSWPNHLPHMLGSGSDNREQQLHFIKWSPSVDLDGLS